MPLRRRRRHPLNRRPPSSLPLPCSPLQATLKSVFEAFCTFGGSAGPVTGLEGRMFAKVRLVGREGGGAWWPAGGQTGHGGLREAWMPHASPRLKPTIPSRQDAPLPLPPPHR